MIIYDICIYSTKQQCATETGSPPGRVPTGADGPRGHPASQGQPTVLLFPAADPGKTMS